jgi:hypothetical protein
MLSHARLGGVTFRFLGKLSHIFNSSVYTLINSFVTSRHERCRQDTGVCCCSAPFVQHVTPLGG